ncbi:MAG: hypothetical protein ACRC7O_11675 [Fimbriiglobus sp.]
MLPEPLIAEFWDDVRNHLASEFGISRPDTVFAVDGYRRLLDERNVGDWVYHRDASAVAETLAAGWQSGALKPTLAASAQ